MPYRLGQTVQDRLPAVTQDTRCDPLCEQRRPAGQIYIGCLGECAIRAPPYHYIADASCDRRALHRYAVISAQAIDEHVGFAASNVMMERLYVINSVSYTHLTLPTNREV